MSNALALAAVTAVLKDLLNNGLIDHDVSNNVGNVTVSALAPDRITTGDTEESQLNIFLYHLSPNPSWRNVGLPSRDIRGNAISNPPLALDLHYMLTAYGAQDFHAEILLGYGMQILHEVPVLSREAIRLSLAPPSPVVGGGGLPPALEALATSELAEQVEQIKITPQVMTTEEMYRIWTAFQAHYRPTAAYLVSVVLIESMRPVRSPLPVLTQGMLDRGPQAQPNLIPPLPALIEVLPPNRQPGLRLGETLRLRGRTLEGANPVASFSHAQFDEPIERPLTLISASEAEVVLPNAPSIWPAGIYTVTVAVQQAGETVPRITNRLPFALVPTINSISASRDAEERVNFSVSCTPAVFPNQRVSLTVGDQEILVSAPTSASGNLTVTAVGLAAGTYRVRLRVDGIDSLLVNYATTPPSFDPTQEVTVP